MSVVRENEETLKVIGGYMYKKCEEILNDLENQGKIKKLDFTFPSKQELKLKLKDILEDDVDEKYYLTDEQVSKIKASTFHQNNRRIQEKEYCDTLCARDWKDPKCVVADYRYDEGLRIRKNGLSPCLTTKIGSPSLSGNTLLIKNATKQGYLEATDGDGCYITNIDKKRGTVQKEMIPTLKTSPDIGCVVSDLRIRKLTPRETWRLMGFDDEDFEKADKVNSNTQLYKQAGNSIVVNVLEAIFKNLLKDYLWSDLD